MPRDDDLEDLRSEESSRGTRRPIGDAAARRRRAKLLAAFRTALQEADEGLFLEAIRRDLGLKDGTPGFLRAVKVWRQFRGRS